MPFPSNDVVGVGSIGFDGGGGGGGKITWEEEERRRQKLKAAVMTASQAQRLFTVADNKGPRLTGIKAKTSKDESRPFILIGLIKLIRWKMWWLWWEEKELVSDGGERKRDGVYLKGRERKGDAENQEIKDAKMPFS